VSSADHHRGKAPPIYHHAHKLATVSVTPTRPLHISMMVGLGMAGGRAGRPVAPARADASGPRVGFSKLPLCYWMPKTGHQSGGHLPLGDCGRMRTVRSGQADADSCRSAAMPWHCTRGLYLTVDPGPRTTTKPSRSSSLIECGTANGIERLIHLGRMLAADVDPTKLNEPIGHFKMRHRRRIASHPYVP
jgi:hypothetical protein